MRKIFWVFSKKERLVERTYGTVCLSIWIYDWRLTIDDWYRRSTDFSQLARRNPRRKRNAQSALKHSKLKKDWKAISSTCILLRENVEQRRSLLKENVSLEELRCNGKKWLRNLENHTLWKRKKRMWYLLTRLLAGKNGKEPLAYNIKGSQIGENNWRKVKTKPSFS